MIWRDRVFLLLLSGVAGLLTVATLIGLTLRFRAKDERSRRTVDNLNARIRAWWVMVMVFGLALCGGRLGVTVLFGLISFLALREMLTLTPTRRGDHHTLFWAFFVMVPIQYVLVYINWYGFFAVFIPIYCFIFLAIRSTLTGDCTNYLERTAKIQWGVLIAVYFLSHAPNLLMLDIPGFGGRQWRLLVFLVIVVQMSDVLQYVWGKLTGSHPIAPNISPNKTWEGFVGGVASATLLGGALYRLTPFTFPAACGLALTICVMGFFGGIVMSAIKRDAGIKDYGHLIEGHGGMMDRVDSLCFAAPVFFHVVRYYYVPSVPGW
jgi:phosphatidate cytidylyltransferase